jgi:hypothetical protein
MAQNTTPAARRRPRKHLTDQSLHAAEPVTLNGLNGDGRGQIADIVGVYRHTTGRRRHGRFLAEVRRARE